MILYDVNPGDRIRVPTHYPQVITVTGFFPAGADARLREHTRLEWAAAGWSGITTLAENTPVEMICQAPEDDPIRVAAQERTEAALAALAALAEETGEGVPADYVHVSSFRSSRQRPT